MSLQEVETHYELLDRFRLEAFGQSVHHGLWTRGDESLSEAVAAMQQHILTACALSPKERACDIGCGYGAFAEKMSQQGANVVGYTLSRVQYEQAVKCASSKLVSFVYGDWLDNHDSDASFDIAVAVESLEHFPDKNAFFAELARVVRPGGRVVIASWLAAGTQTTLSERLFHRPILKEHRFPSLLSSAETQRRLSDAGFALTRVETLASRVYRTWPESMKDGLVKLRSAEQRRLLRDHPRDSLALLKSSARLWAAYRLGALDYGIFCGTRD